MTESPNASDITKLQGGRAPEDRQCRYVFGHGRHCRSWAIRGHEFCHRHLRWDECRVDGPIEVPLMEDPSSVTLVLSQTARALGWGHIPPDNGRAIIAACRVAQAGFNHQLALAKFRLKLHRLGLDPSDFLPASAATATATEPTPITQSTAVPQAAADNQEPVILSAAPQRGAESKDLHSTTAHPTDLHNLNAAEDPLTASPLPAGAPFNPSVGLSGNQRPAKSQQKTMSEAGSLKGHGFSRAVTGNDKHGALAAKGSSAPEDRNVATSAMQAGAPARYPYTLSDGCPIQALSWLEWDHQRKHGPPRPQLRAGCE